jgi:hypothetical protein
MDVLADRQREKVRARIRRMAITRVKQMLYNRAKILFNQTDPH